jgi:hypothetical protein
MNTKNKMTLAETVQWLKKNVHLVEGFQAAKLKAKKAGVSVYPRAWGAAFGTKEPATKKAPAKRSYTRRAVATKVKPASSFTIVIESAVGRSEMSFKGAHISLDTGANTLTVKQAD